MKKVLVVDDEEAILKVVGYALTVPAYIAADGLSRHLAGKLAVVVQNQPGAGSVIAMNNYANRVPRDGTTVLIGSGQLLVRLILGLDGARVVGQRIDRVVEVEIDPGQPVLRSPLARERVAIQLDGMVCAVEASSRIG